MAPSLDTTTRSVRAAATTALESRDAPEQPAFLSIARPPILPVAGRVLETGPPAGGICPSAHRFAGPYPFPPCLEPTQLRVVARSLLEFAHDSMIARSGALSSFSTSLPPPLLA